MRPLRIPSPARSLPRGRAAALVLLLLALVVSPAHAQAQADTAAAPEAVPDKEEPTWLADHSPRGALWRSAALPGWGQVYNRQYLKAPIAAAAVGGVIYAAFDTNRNYLLYKRAHIYQRGVEDDTVPPSPQYEDEYNLILARTNRQDIPASELKRQRENLNRYRDLSIVGIGVVYALTMLDAYVAAHLLQFDVSEDLSLRAYPTPHGPAATLRLHL